MQTSPVIPSKSSEFQWLRIRLVGIGAKLVLFAAIFSTCIGCGNEDRGWKETIPVTGVIYVNGEPAEGVSIEFHPTAGMDQEQPTQTSAISETDGKFTASTYEVKDGAPAGEYKLLFKWPKLNPISMTFDGDRLNKRYDKLEASEHTINVESGKPLDLGRIELNTK